MLKNFFFMQEKISRSKLANSQAVLLYMAILLLLIPCIVESAGQRHNPWSYSDHDLSPTSVRPWANKPLTPPSSRYNHWREPPVDHSYYRPTYPYRGYSSAPYSEPSFAYGYPYNPYQLPGYGGVNGIYPGLQGGPMTPTNMYLYPGW